MLTPYFEDDSSVIYHHAECRDLIDVCDYTVMVTDPPYGTGGWRRARDAEGRTMIGRPELVAEDWDDGNPDWIRPVPTVTFWPSSGAVNLLNAAIAVGLVKHRALYMRKRDPKPQFGGRTMWSVEPIWVLSPDGWLLTGGGTDWCEVSTPREGRDADATGHPYEKPIDVMHWILGKLPPGTVILDPFMGSGTTLRAAKDLGLRAIGIERDEQWCEVAARRLSQGVLDFGRV